MNTLNGFWDFLPFVGEDDAAMNATKSMIDNFKTKARAWASQVVDLINTPVKDPGLIAEKKSLLKWAKVIRKSVEGVTGTMDELDTAGLGILPLIPVAIIAAALAAIGKWSLDYKKLKAKIAMHEGLVSDGTDPRKASQIVNAVTGRNPLISFGGTKLVGVALLLGGGYFLAKQQKWIK